MVFVIGMQAYVFGWGEFSAKSSSTGEFSMGKKISREWTFLGNFKQQEYARILIQNSFYMYCFLFSVWILCAGWLRVIITGIELSTECFHGEGVSMWRWSQISWHHLKKQLEIKWKKKQVFHLEVRSNIKT